MGRYDSILDDLVRLLDAARTTSARAINTVMTATYWQIGRRIVEAEQAGVERAEDFPDKERRSPVG